MAVLALSNENFRRLSQKKVFDIVSAICNTLANAGGYPFLVGGCVRDAILQIPLLDFDIEVFGLSLKKIEKILSGKFAVGQVGRKFCVLKVDGVPIDISVPRDEIKFGPKHTDFHVFPLENCNIKSAASRRDFTINAIYFDFIAEKIIDEFCGIDDLKNGILRHVSNKFSEDPLRVLRGMQFAGRFKLKAAIETVNLCKDLSMHGLSKERLFWEWEKLILKSKQPSMGMRFLKEVGWLKFFPEIASIDSCMQDPIRHPEGTVFEHTCLSLDAYANARTGNIFDDTVLGFATLCHDFGKPYVTTEDEYGIHHYNHDKAGLVPTENFLNSINAPQNIIDGVIPLVEWHMTPRDLYRDNRTDAAVLKLANNVFRIDLLLKLCYVDFVGRTNWASRYDGSIENWLRSSAEKLGVLKNKPIPIIQGRDLINLGLSPSKQFARILDDCFDAQLSGKFFDRSSGIAYLRKIIL